MNRLIHQFIHHLNCLCPLLLSDFYRPEAYSIWKLFTCEHDHVILSMDEIPSITVAGTLISVWLMGISPHSSNKGCSLYVGQKLCSQGGKHQTSTPFLFQMG